MPSKLMDAAPVQATLEAVQRVTGLTILRQEQAIAVEMDDGRMLSLPYKIKRVVDRRDQLLAFKTFHSNAVLITRSLSSTMADQCRQLGIQFIDAAGNCFLQQTGLFVLVSGRKDAAMAKSITASGLTPAALRVILAVLTQPTILNTTVRRIAEVAGISHGAAGGALINLEELGFFVTLGSGRRALIRPERWLDTWAEGYLGRIRPKLQKLRMSSPMSLPAALEHVQASMQEVALGGEAAAAHFKLGLKPGALTLYADFNDEDVMSQLTRELKLRRDSEGAIELVDMFWNTRELPCFPTVPDAVMYADLVGAGDSRTVEIVALLKKEICAHVAGGE